MELVELELTFYGKFHGILPLISRGIVLLFYLFGAYGLLESTSTEKPNPGESNRGLRNGDSKNNGWNPHDLS